MKRVIEFALDSGDVIRVETDEPAPAGGVRRAATAAKTVEKARHSFDAALAQVRPAVEAVLAQLREVSARPDKVAVEMGVKLSAEAGAVIASASTEANFKITLTWESKPGA